MGAEAPELRVLYAPDYAPNEQVEHRLKLLQQEIQRLVPHRVMKMLRAEGPVVDDYGDAAWIEGSDKGWLPADKLILAVRRDLMTSAAKLLRFAHLSRSEILVGDGQGALTGLQLTKPSFMEVMLQMRNFQAEELRLVSTAWGKIRGVIALGP